jgi:hypothetical protein
MLLLTDRILMHHEVSPETVARGNLRLAALELRAHRPKKTSNLPQTGVMKEGLPMLPQRCAARRSLTTRSKFADKAYRQDMFEAAQTWLSPGVTLRKLPPKLLRCSSAPTSPSESAPLV